MVETRIAPRYRINKPASIDYGRGNYPCTVRDISVSGAALDFQDQIRLIGIPEKFTLMLPDDGLTLSCRVVWRRDYRMGVTFD